VVVEWRVVVVDEEQRWGKFITPWEGKRQTSAVVRVR
jgi:hypothetical protein